jgi:F0F1-type ATP synthase delta subunit
VLENQFKGADVIDIELNGDNLTVTIRSAEPITQQDAQQADQALDHKLGRNINLEITYWPAVKP